MKKIYFFTVLVLIGSLFSCNQRTSVKGEIQGLGNDTIWVKSVKMSEFFSGISKTDTIIAKNDKFEYSPQIDELCMFFMSPKKLRANHLNVFLDKNEHIKITGKLDNNNRIDAVITGSEFNEVNLKITNSLQEEDKEIVALNEKIKKTTDNEEKQLLYKKRRVIIRKIREKQIEYIKNNPNSQYSGFLLGRHFYLDNFEKHYGLLTPAVQQGAFASILNYKKAICDAQRKIIVGSQAPYFKLKTLNGKDFTLDDIANKKYIILDFWGSWCGGCIKGFPKMEAYYQKYKSQIEIVGIDCKDTREKWEKVVTEFKPSWVQVREDKNKTAYNYGVQGYPTKIILDKNHKIVGIFRGEGEDFYQKLDELLQNK